MAPLWQELSSLEVEVLELVRNAPESEQDRDLDTLTILGDLDVVTVLAEKGDFPVNKSDYCCCFICCCFC